MDMDMGLQSTAWRCSGARGSPPPTRGRSGTRATTSAHPSARAHPSSCTPRSGRHAAAAPLTAPAAHSAAGIAQPVPAPRSVITWVARGRGRARGKAVDSIRLWDVGLAHGFGQAPERPQQPLLRHARREGLSTGSHLGPRMAAPSKRTGFWSGGKPHGLLRVASQGTWRAARPHGRP